MTPTIGGGGRERWMVLLPVTAAALVSIMVIGGPARMLTVLEGAARDVWQEVVRLLGL